VREGGYCICLKDACDRRGGQSEKTERCLKDATLPDYVLVQQIAYKVAEIV